MKILPIFAALMILGALSYAQDNSAGRNTQVVEGNITSTDWVGSVIAVNDMSIYVPSGTRIYKGNDSIGLDDVNIGDPVVVTYYDDPPGNHKAVSIVIQYNGEFAT